MNASSAKSSFVRSPFVIVGVPFVLYCVHAWFFGNWIIDDAGISFAYARNLAYGHGLVSQPGAMPVEGYSNFTWVMLLVPFFLLRIFDPILTPKIVSLAFILLSFASVRGIFRSVSTRPSLGAGLCNSLLAINTSFVAWTISGLENPLLLLLALLLLRQVLLYAARPQPRRITHLAILAALLAMTRPDGIVYAVVPVPFLLLHATGVALPAKARALRHYLSLFALIFGCFLAFRLAYFHDILPNTYYAKGGPTQQELVQVLLLQPPAYMKIAELFHAVASFAGNAVFFGLILTTAYLMYVRALAMRHLALLSMLVCSGFIYVLLPSDWMGAHRFATPFIGLFYPSVFIIVETAVGRMNHAWTGRSFTLIVIATAAFGISAAMSVNRTARFIREPVAPFTETAEAYGRVFDRYAERLHVTNGSILLPDVGGPLYHSKLRVFDLGGLTDRTIAHTMGKRQRQFYDYVFDVAKPTFIHTHAYWAYLARFDADARFRQQYVPIREQHDPWIMQTYHEEILAGDYVRKDILGGDEEALRWMRAELYSPPTIGRNQ